MNPKAFAWGIGLCIAGGLIGLFGLIIMSIRVRLAVVFLGARVMFDMPFANADATKIVLVSLFALNRNI